MIQKKRWIKEDTQIHALASLCAAYFSPKMMKSLRGGKYFKTISTLSCHTLKICSRPYEVVPFFCNFPYIECGLNYTNIKYATNVNCVWRNFIWKRFNKFSIFFLVKATKIFIFGHIMFILPRDYFVPKKWHITTVS